MAGDLKRVYKFYGWEDAGKVSPEAEGYERIRDLLGMYDLMTEIWSKETCAPRMRDRWCPENKTLGQCSITAFIVQDLFGGEVYGIPREGGTFHCYNVVDGKRFDLTSEQFGEEAKELVYDDKYLQTREIHFAKAEKKERYVLLKSLVEKYKT